MNNKQNNKKYGLTIEQADRLIEAGPEVCDYFEDVCEYMNQIKIKEDKESNKDLKA
jgi:hypothetical protein